GERSPAIGDGAQPRQRQLAGRRPGGVPGAVLEPASAARLLRAADRHAEQVSVEGAMTREELRLQEARQRTAHWRRWGPYLAERQWGTVREDASAGGTAWDSLPHDHARSRACRWGEDGIPTRPDSPRRRHSHRPQPD